MSINTNYRCIRCERLEQLIAEVWDDPAAVESYLNREGEERWLKRELELWTERNRVGLHSLLTWGDWANQLLLGKVIAGGTYIGWGYCYPEEPARYLTVEQVRDISEALQSVEESALRSSYDPAALNAAGLPPVGGWHEDDFRYLWQTFCAIRDFFQMAQSEHYALLIYIC